VAHPQTVFAVTVHGVATVMLVPEHAEQAVHGETPLAL
jgi:hypothetical protein